MYCGNHDVVGCTSCMALTHRGCTDVELISDAISTIFKKADVDKTSIMLQDKIKQMEKIINIRVALFKQLMDSKTEAITAIQQFKTEMELILQNLLKESINEVEEECCKREMILEEEKKKAESEVETMQLADDNLRQSDANRAQQFVNMKIAQQQVTSVDAIIGSMEALSDAQLTFTEDENIRDTLRRLKTLGTVYRFSPFKPRTIAYTHTGTSDMDARLANDKSICNIISSCLTARDMLLLADLSNQKLKNVDISKMSVVDQCDLPSRPFCLCAAREHEAVVCLGNNTIQFVSLADKMKLTSHLSLGHTFYGIAYKAEKLFVTDNGHFLYIYDMKGNQLLKVSHGTSGNKIFKCSEQIIFNDDGDKLQIVDWSNRIVTLDTNGKYINIISDSDIAQAHGICTDGRGNVFVCGHGSNNVIQIGKNGKKLGVLLKSSNGLSSPWSVCFDPRRCILFVFNESSDRVKVFYLQ